LQYNAVAKHLADAGTEQGSGRPGVALLFLCVLDAQFFNPGAFRIARVDYDAMTEFSSIEIDPEGAVLRTPTIRGN
jgi:hypothetical protein